MSLQRKLTRQEPLLGRVERRGSCQIFPKEGSGRADQWGVHALRGSQHGTNTSDLMTWGLHKRIRRPWTLEAK